MKYVLVLFALLVSACTTVSNAIAEDDPEFLSDMVRLEKLMNEDDKCSERWDIMWKWAKRGNMQARSMIFFLMAPPPEMAPIYLPGNSGDLLTTKRDMMVFLVHSYDHDAFKKYYGDGIYEIFELGGFSESPSGQKFMECVKNQNSSNCADMAVQNNLAPSFEDYAAQIDAFMAQGMTSTCLESFKRIK